MHPSYHHPVPPPASNSNGAAIAVEAILSLFGVYGVGWLMAGKKSVGIPIMLGGFVWDIIVLVIGLVTVGTGFCCLLPLHFLLIAFSTIMLATQHSHSNQQITNRYSSDGQYWWNGQSWQSVIAPNNPLAPSPSQSQSSVTQYSPDGQYWWDGQTWQPINPISDH